MRPSARDLALRDPALAALMGADVGSDFGFDGTYDDERPSPRRRRPSSTFGYEFGYAPQFGYSPQFGAADLATASELPPPQVAAQLWAAHKQQAARTAERTDLLEPNRGSEVKVERYVFNVNQALVIGVALVGFIATNQPDTNIRPQRVTANAPSPGFVTINEIKVANVSVIVGGISDAWEFNANGVGQSLDLPTLQPANRASVTGTYTGFVPPGFVIGAPFTFCVGLKGPASVIN
jgi:hypothetical protein